MKLKGIIWFLSKTLGMIAPMIAAMIAYVVFTDHVAPWQLIFTYWVTVFVARFSHALYDLLQDYEDEEEEES